MLPPCKPVISWMKRLSVLLAMMTVGIAASFTQRAEDTATTLEFIVAACETKYQLAVKRQEAAVGSVLEVAEAAIQLADAKILLFRVTKNTDGQRDSLKDKVNWTSKKYELIQTQNERAVATQVQVADAAIEWNKAKLEYQLFEDEQKTPDGATVPVLPRPNIVLIFMDDMGFADIGPFGGTVPTPHLDTLAKEGRRFTHFVVSSAVCSASRSALMTGCLHRRVGIAGALMPNSPIGLHPDEDTIADVCKRQGYSTACFGKWHLGDKPPFLPTKQGFDAYFGIPYSNDMWPFPPSTRNHPPLPLYEGETIANPAVDAKAQEQLTTQITEHAVAFIEKNKNNPFFLYVPHPMVHVPLHVSEKFAGKSGKGLFGDVVMEIDWSVGEIIAALKRNGLDKNTLVIFTSDNGPWLNYGEHAGSAGPLREGKGTSFEGGIREPTIFWFPGRIPSGTVCNELASTIDVLPTVCGLIGAPLPQRKIDGKDIWPLVSGSVDTLSPHKAIPIYFSQQLQAIRDTRWKLVFPHQYRSLDGKDGGSGGKSVSYVQRPAELSLYDLTNDVGETTDVKDKHPDVLLRLQKIAEEYRAELGEGTQFGPGVRPAGNVKNFPSVHGVND